LPLYKILVLAEHFEGKLRSSTWEAIGVAQALSKTYPYPIKIVIIGNETHDLAVQLSKGTGMEVLEISNEWCQTYTPDIYCDLLVYAIRQISPFFVLMGHSHRVTDFAPKLASMLETGFISNCSGFDIEPDGIAFSRNVYNGKVNQKVSLKGDPPHIISLQEGIFKKCLFIDTPISKVTTLDTQLSSNLTIKRKVLEIVQEVQGKIDLTKAEIIVSGGRGVGSKVNFGIVFDLANILGASVGATRPAVDNGWLSKGHQVGTSGVSVAPKLYIACGISGAPQHLAGIVNADCIVAINTDPYAPIFQVADYGIVGDLFGIVPAMTQCVKESKNLL